MHNDLLNWYDTKARTLLWRKSDPEPYSVWVSEIMLQQTTVKTVTPYFEKFMLRFPTVEVLAQASLDDVFQQWQGLGYYSRARNLHKCAQQIVLDGFPKTSAELINLPGIGPYTAAAIASIAFNEAIVPVDGNIIRVLARLNALTTPLPDLKKVIEDLASSYASPLRPGDFAQALMDLGATVCTPSSPKCPDCPLQLHCQAFKKGLTEDIPYKKEKKAKPTRYGHAYIIIKDGQIFLRRRGPKGLLAHMIEVPTTDWLPSPQQFEGLSLGTVKHTFTHFHLYLDVLKGSALPNGEGFWAPLNQLEMIALPTLIKKVLRVAGIQI